MTTQVRGDRQQAPVPLRRLSRSGPLRIAMLASATGANLHTLLSMQDREPATFQVLLIASHAASVPALEVARRAGVEAWPGDFDQACGLASAAATPAAQAGYRQRARDWHDRLDRRLESWERRSGPLDLIVLAYHRWIEGRLLDRYRHRMVNQHPADLSLLDGSGRRLLTGRDPVLAAMAHGLPATRTSCFLVDGSRDGGAVLCMGPPVPVDGRTATREGAREQELIQKARSDRPCLEWTVRAFAAGRLAVSAAVHRDGSRIVLVDGTPTTLGGMRLGDIG